MSIFLQSQLSAVQSERDELAEANNNLRKTIADLEQEIQRWVGGMASCDSHVTLKAARVC